MMERRLMQTDDGSATLYVPAMDEHYHSVKGARAEAEHIYIEMGFVYASELQNKKQLRVLEVGLGTGLNALLTQERCSLEKLFVHYIAVELYPLTWDEVSPLGYSDSTVFRELHSSAWEEDVALTEYFKIRKLQSDIKDVNIAPVDVIFYDAFAPEKQPEMWTLELMQKMYQLLAPNGVLTTYCAKGVVRRMLQQVGFKVERLAGPVGGKREILRAIKVE